MTSTRDGAPVRILGRASSINVRKVLWTAAETGTPYVREMESAAYSDGERDRLRSLHPTGLAPVLIAGDGPLWESNAICRYLAGAAGRADLLPQAPFARAEVEKWMDWQATDLNSAWRPAFSALVRPGDPVEPKVLRASVETWNSLMLLVDARLARTDGFIAGETFTLADIVIGLSLQRWLLTPIQRPDTPALTAYFHRLCERPAAHPWMGQQIP